MDSDGCEDTCSAGQSFLQSEGHAFEERVDGQSNHDDKGSGGVAAASLFLCLRRFDKLFVNYFRLGVLVINRWRQ